MMKFIKLTKIITQVLIAISLLILGVMTVLASSATITFTSNEDTVLMDEQVTITLTIKSNAEIGDFEAFITYNDNVLEYITGSKNINGGDGTLKISDRNISEASLVRKYTMKFQGIDIGTSEIAIRDISVLDYNENLEMSVASSKLQITVNPASNASAINELSSLKISPGKLEPDFKEDTLNYLAEVEPDVTNLIISAVAKDSKASILVEGNNNLKEGNNTILINVTAENGITKIYTIQTTKKSGTEGTTEVIPQATEGDELPVDIVVTEQEGDIFIKGAYSYKIIQNEDNVVPKGYIRSEISIDDIVLMVYINEVERYSDFVLLYAQDKLGEENLYQYDTNERTMQRYKSIPQTDGDFKDEFIEQDVTMDKTDNHLIVIMILSALCILLIIIIIKQFLKNRNNEDNY